MSSPGIVHNSYTSTCVQKVGTLDAVERAVAICQRLHAATSLPVWIKPNAGLPTIDSAGLHYATSAEFFASHFGALREAGASFLGACCGSTPEFIGALVRARTALQA